MKLADRISSFAILGDLLRNFSIEKREPSTEVLYDAIYKTSQINPWFTIDNQTDAIKALSLFLDHDSIQNWVLPYHSAFDQYPADKTVAVVMAGNIPLVGFHDFLCVLIAGYKIIIKLSGDDPFLIPAMSRLLCDINPDWESRIRFSEGALKGFDAIIATGSDNTSRHFEFYFSKYPHIIRHHRNSIAILTGREEPETLRLLASDILQYFGLGCRNISKLYVPADYNFSLIEEAVQPYLHLLNHHKYRNNYDYNRTMFMLNQIPFRELGPILVTESRETASRIAVLHYSYYSDFEALKLEIDELAGQIQCVVCQEPFSNSVIYPGESQFPDLEDYADQVNTLEFLAKI